MNRRVVLIGAVHEAMAAFHALVDHEYGELVAVVTLTETAGTSTAGFVDLAELAAPRGVPVIRVKNVNDAEAVAQIRRLDPALIAVVGWTRLIGEELLAVPTMGCVGFHASLLPRNRGRAPVNWSMLRGESTTGNTFMLLNAGVDTGQILDQRSTPIYLDDTCATVYERISGLGADMLTQLLQPLLQGEVRPSPQDESTATVLPARTPEMGVTDWQRSPVDVHNWIRAQTTPYPGAFTHYLSRRIWLWATEPPMMAPATAEPGTILAIEGEAIRVSAGGGSILITSMGSSPSQRLSASEWVADVGAKRGDRFEIPSRDLVAWSLGLGPRPTFDPKD